MITNSQYWVVRSKTERQSIESGLLRELQKIDRDAATSNIRPMEDYLSESVAPRRFSLQILTIFAAASLLLAVTGIYGYVSRAINMPRPPSLSEKSVSSLCVSSVSSVSRW